MSKYDVKLESKEIGEDLLVILTGGEKPHAGAVAFAGPYDASAYSSVISKPGHKESDLAKLQAERICKRLKKNVVLVAGIHIDNATKNDIDILLKNAVAQVDRFLGASA